MREDVTNRDDVLAVLRKLGEVIRDAILDVQQAELVELQDQEGGHAL
jgi:hypothetical protein